MTTAKFSQNFSFTVRKLYEQFIAIFCSSQYARKGSGELYNDTVARAEGQAASIAFGKIKDEGMHSTMVRCRLLSYVPNPLHSIILTHK